MSVGVDLQNGENHIDLTWEDWREINILAEHYGWKPMDTIDDGSRRMEYFSNDGQDVCPLDPVIFAEALERALKDVDNWKAPEIAGIDIDLVEEFYDFCTIF